MLRKMLITAVGLVCFGALAAPAARATEWNKETIFTFSQPVQIEGKVLPAGRYDFRLVDPDSGDKYVVGVFNPDNGRLLTMVMGYPAGVRDVPNHTILRLKENRIGQPETIVEWIYPWDTQGLAFPVPHAVAQARRG